MMTRETKLDDGKMCDGMRWDKMEIRWRCNDEMMKWARIEYSQARARASHHPGARCVVYKVVGRRNTTYSLLRASYNPASWPGITVILYSRNVCALVVSSKRYGTPASVKLDP